MWLKTFFYLFLLQFIKTTILKKKYSILWFVTNISSSIPVSVLIPIYNKEKYLQRSFNSLFNQTFTNFEMVVVDDCSIDSSTEFVLNKMKTDSRIKLIQHKYNQGIGISRNHALLTARGLYIMSLDPDDEYVNNSIEISYQNALKYNADVLEFRIAGIHHNYTDYNWMNCRRSYQGNEAVLKQLQKFRYGNPDIHTCKKIIRRFVYAKAVCLILPYIKNKRICISEDLLHVGTIFIFAKNYICTQFLVYLYYRNLLDSSISKGYVSKFQKYVTHNYVKQVLRYFYRCRNNTKNCNVNEFLNENGNRELYNRISNVDRLTKKNLSFIHNYELNYIDFANDGYLLFFN